MEAAAVFEGSVVRRNARSHEQIELLTVMADATQPVGSRTARRALAEAGIELSESSVARLLRSLDREGLTRPTDGKGRVLTTEGRRLARALAGDRQRSAEFADALDVRNVRDLLDLLATRRGVEREAARAAADLARPEDLEMLAELLARHEEAVRSGHTPRLIALEFHRRIGELSRNKLLAAMVRTIFDPNLDDVERVLDVITARHHTAGRSPKDHELILAALRARDPDAAETAMVRHLNRLIEETKAYAATERAPLIEQLFGLMEAPADGA